MKFQACSIVVLCASLSSAFVPEVTKSPAFKALHSTPPYLNTNTGVGTGVDASGASALQKSGVPSSESEKAKNIWADSTSVKVEGGSLRTWSFATPDVEAVHVSMKTNGRPLNANVDLWQGPDNTPQKMGVYIEDGKLRPFNAVIATPRGQNTIAIRNTAQMEFPLHACVKTNVKDGQTTSDSLSGFINALSETSPEIVQGGAIKTYSFAPSVVSVQILLETDGRPLNSRIELLQGPNNNKQVIEVYTEDGVERPFYIVVESPGSGNVVRIQNTSPLEFPMTARVEPFEIDYGMDDTIIIDGGSVRN
uniref:Uncharacterized protein n=1 Tax=Pseudictyota dubia TaxID=2749911 RepID=A0A7R9VQ28_9STRA|mmetsp:Transcript_2056/g.3544  ORF Transcript_2056/g.3544 Transcript_2056/m.3544 type:complete len:307 (+) Transcript_2056:134-1054(+)|eukprot:CAMPEP_0197457038 /NCGR_PEP_ID=MMETSP1175-20131217/44964_1 /TAXON_ID=1003142 /ORGANISM="Triceratium dubium, Strain CCMP147" /LENGTH=306 /DNA_ID=CAMNT_0042991285 /DNA_START=134 /DNA_END=1054 /DNA_ORIENTATION=+